MSTLVGKTAVTSITNSNGFTTTVVLAFGEPAIMITVLLRLPSL